MSLLGDIRKLAHARKITKGQFGEGIAETNYNLRGYTTERTGRGSDFKATRVNPFTDKKDVRLVEAKHGGSLTKKQRETKKATEERGGKYDVFRPFT